MIADRLKRRKRLILFRHAKSEWPDGVADHERPLSDRGRKAAPVMGVYLQKQKLVPDLALVSTARRAQETWTRTSKALQATVPVLSTRNIYEAEPDKILDAIKSTAPEVRTLIVVGHNPGLEELAKKLMKDLGGEAGTRMREKFPTAAIAVLSFEVDSWQDVTPQTGSLDRFVTPKSLG